MTTDWIVMVISSNFSSRVLSSVSRPWERLHTGGNNQGHSSKADIINVFQYFDFMITYRSTSDGNDGTTIHQCTVKQFVGP